MRPARFILARSRRCSRSRLRENRPSNGSAQETDEDFRLGKVPYHRPPANEKGGLAPSTGANENERKRTASEAPYRAKARKSATDAPKSARTAISARSQRVVWYKTRVMHSERYSTGTKIELCTLAQHEISSEGWRRGQNFLHWVFSPSFPARRDEKWSEIGQFTARQECISRILYQQRSGESA